MVNVIPQERASSGCCAFPTVKLVIEKHADGFVAYPLGLKGIIVGEGDTFEEAWHDVQSAIRFHQDIFGPLETTDDPVEVFIAEAVVA